MVANTNIASIYKQSLDCTKRHFTMFKIATLLLLHATTLISGTGCSASHYPDYPEVVDRFAAMLRELGLQNVGRHCSIQYASMNTWSPYVSRASLINHPSYRFNVTNIVFTGQCGSVSGRWWTYGGPIVIIVKKSVTRRSGTFQSNTLYVYTIGSARHSFQLLSSNVLGDSESEINEYMGKLNQTNKLICSGIIG